MGSDAPVGPRAPDGGSGDRFRDGGQGPDGGPTPPSLTSLRSCAEPVSPDAAWHRSGL